jgi:tol-pal system protein YbgF
MKLRNTMTLLAFCTTACAELPPVTGNNPQALPNPAVAAKPLAAAMTDYEIMKRMEQLQSEVQLLTGKVEEQTYQIEELKKRNKTMYSDFDERLQALENKAGTASTISDTATSMGSNSESSSVPQAAVISSAATGQAVLDAGATQNPAATPPVIEPPVSEVEKQEYQKAYEALRTGRTQEAIEQFSTYLTAHKDSAYASNAQYWLGEAHRVNQDNSAARKAFNDVVTTFPNSAKVPDALLKLGYIEAEENNSSKARDYFDRIITEFPTSKAAKLAEKKISSLDANTP